MTSGWTVVVILNIFLTFIAIHRLVRQRRRFRLRFPCSVPWGFGSRGDVHHRRENARCLSITRLIEKITDCLWQYASMSFLSWVVALILKKTSSPSWDLTFRLSCSVPGVGSDIVGVDLQRGNVKNYIRFELLLALYPQN